MSAPTEEKKEEKKEEETEKQEEDSEIEKLRREIEELKDRNLRQQADIDNYRKQLEKEKEDYRRLCNEKILCELLEVVDNFERAIPELHKKDPKAAEGIDLIYKQLLKIMEKHGLKYIEACGKQFNPYKHEALLSEESDEPEGTILEELQKGYMLHDKVIRHSKVKISKKKNKEGPQNDCN